MIMDYDTKCWQKEHLGWTFGFSLPVLFGAGIIFPYYLMRKIKRNKGRMLDK